MNTYEAPELVTMGEATHIVRQDGRESAESTCGCGYWLFFDGDPLNTDDDLDEEATVNTAGDVVEPRSLEL
jgi:hypothetical protein